MAISLGSLYIELKANTAQFLDGMTKAATNAKVFGRDIETGFSKMGALFAPLGEVGQKLAGVFGMVGSSARGAIAEIGKSGALLGGLAGLTGGAAALGGTLFALAEKASDVGAKIYEASEKTGISAAQMSGLMAITKETGGDFDSLTNSLARAGANLQKAIIEPGALTSRMLAQVMGGAQQLAAEGLKPMGDRLQDVLKHIFALNNTGERNVALSALLGRGWMNNVETLQLLATQGFAPAIAEARKLGIFFDDASARQAKQFQIAIKETTAELAGLGLAIGQKVIPAFLQWITGLQGLLPSLEAWGLRILAIEAAMTGIGIPAAIKMWKEADAKLKESDQVQTNFLIHLQNLTAGEKAQGDETGKLTGATKAHSDALANLISREREQLAMLGATWGESSKFGVEYRSQVAAIERLVAAGGSYRESLVALGLALDIYKKKLSDVKPTVPGIPDLQEANAPPQLKMPAMPAGLIGPPPEIISATLAQLALLPRGLEDTRADTKAMRLEADLSTGAFAKLAAAFPTLTEAEVASLPAGQRMIDQLAKMDKLGGLSDRFKEFTDSLVLAGDDFGGKLFKTIGGAIDQLEDKFAELAVKGRANFRQILPSLEEGLAKAGLQKGVGMLTSGIGGLFGKGGGTSRADGSASSPFYVVLASAARGLIGGPTGQGIAKPAGIPNLSAIPNLMGQLFSSAGGNSGTGTNPAGGGANSGIMGALGPLSKGLGSLLSIFKGFLAGGGNVTPGHAYVVGEKHPEFFLPRQSGAIVPSLRAQELRPVSVTHIWQIATPDADSFRRSQSQIMAGAHSATALASARNG
jgi:hypothetical protein